MMEKEVNVDLFEDIWSQSGLDPNSKRLFMLMLWRSFPEDGINLKTFRFNRLYRLTEVYKLNLTRPTFSTCLTKLVEKGFVKREEKGKQHVEYTLNIADVFRIKTAMGILAKAISFFHRDYIIPTSKIPLYIANFMTLMNLLDLRSLLQYLGKDNPLERLQETGICQLAVNTFERLLMVACMTNQKMDEQKISMLLKASNLAINQTLQTLKECEADFSPAMSK